MSAFVIDNSVVSGWLIENQSSAYSDAVAERFKTSRAIAPPLLRLEVTRMCCARPASANASLLPRPTQC